MAHFISLLHSPPVPEDDIEVVDASAGGFASIGLWGFMNGGVECEVKVTSGPGVAKKGNKIGAVRVWDLSQLNPQSKIRAFSGEGPFSEELPVRIAPGVASLAEQNRVLLEGEDPDEKAFIDGNPVAIVPLKKGIGDYHLMPKMQRVRGLAIHTTGQVITVEGCRNTFETAGTSAHFMIDRKGVITQFVAATIRSQAQGPGNGHFISVEMVGGEPRPYAFDGMTPDQMGSLRKLWGWVRKQHPHVPNLIARAYTGREKDDRMGSGLAAVYRAVAAELAASGFCAGQSPSLEACIDSWGVSCHWWLDRAPKPCPGLAMMEQLTEVIGQPRIRVNGDERFIP